MSDIGVGDMVIAVRRARGDDSLTVGALYRVTGIDTSLGGCVVCHSPDCTVLFIAGKPRLVVTAESNWLGYCPCAFRKWPPPADEELRSEGVDADEEQPSKHPAEEPA